MHKWKVVSSTVETDINNDQQPGNLLKHGRDEDEHFKKVKKTKIDDSTCSELREPVDNLLTLESILCGPKEILLQKFLMGENGSQDLRGKACTVTLQELQQIIVAAPLGSKSPFPLRLSGQKKISYTVVVLVNGITVKDYQDQDYGEFFPEMKILFPSFIEVVPSTSGKSIYEELYQFPVPLTTNEDFIQEHHNNKAKHSEIMHRLFKIDSSNNSFVSKSDSLIMSKTQLLLSPLDMVQYSFPLPSDGDQVQTYFFTKDVYEKVTDSSPLFALDCEMCLTERLKQELTKVSIVNEKGQEVYNSLVKPKCKIIDYCTKFSGISKGILDPVNTRLKNVQKDIQTLLPPDAILCGHSLNNDLNALEMFHPYIIDTSIIYNLSGDPLIKPSLRNLAKIFLNRTIQNVKIEGHDPKEDSIAALDLVNLKLTKDMSFGIQRCEGKLFPKNLHKKDSFTNIFERMDQYIKKDMSFGIRRCEGKPFPENLPQKDSITSIFKLMDQYKKKVCILGLPKHISQFTNEVAVKVECKGNNEIAAKTLREAINYDISFVHLDNLKLKIGNEVDAMNEKLKYFHIDCLIAEIYRSLFNKASIIVIFHGSSKSSSGQENGLCFFRKIK